ncbi:MAG: translation initiation factor IF-3 [Chloroflexi bacterium]|nr:translation initiation factor IF-3 [Chloroflexota bacterium]
MSRAYLAIQFRRVKISKTQYRVNRDIRANKVRLITTDGNAGVVDIREAQRLADEAGLDLVEVAPSANPPVVKIMDYGKFQYDQAKKEKAAKKQQKTQETKEIRLRPKTDDHHLNIYIKNARKWLESGMKVKVRVRFRGREITYPEIAREKLDFVAEQLSDVGEVEQHPSMEGRTMLMVLAPAKE